MTSRSNSEDPPERSGEGQRSAGAQRAEEVYGDYLARARESGIASPDFAALVEAYPELRAELRTLQADQRALVRIRGRIGVTEGLRDASLVRLLDELAAGRGVEERFELLREIGVGGQGRIVEAFERTLGRHVAIKRLRDGRETAHGPGTREAFLARFLAEAQITAQLDHPGIVAVHELAVDSMGEPYFSMTRVRGSELGEVFRRSRDGDPQWPLVRCLHVLLRVCETLEFAHSRGVVHRDVKPANVMVGSHGEVFVMDWGLARVGSGPDPGEFAVRTIRDRRDDPDSLLATQPSGKVGTVYYLAPETVADDSGEVAAAVDIYAAGAMLYELLSGKPPYWSEDGDPDHILEQIERAGPEALVGPAPELNAILARAMARDPEERYGSAGQLAGDLRAFLENRVVQAHATGPWAELRKWLVRNRRFALALGLAFFMTVAGLVGIALQQAHARVQLDLEADLYRVPYLEERAEHLWPEVPALVPAFHEWIVAAERLVGRSDLHREELERLRSRTRGVRSEAEDLLRLDTLAATIDRLDDLAAPESGLLAEMRRRREWASSVEHLTLELPAQAWARARQAVGHTDGVYGDSSILLDPRSGLIPLGPDPASGMEEFALPRSGAVPGRGVDGRLTLDASSAVVFVLLPGGPSRTGAQSTDPRAPAYDPQARPEEAPVHELELDPFWIAKHELTQGQWARLGGGRPSFEIDGVARRDLDRHPVQGVSWSECVALLARFSLTLPTEDQWEYAARGGTEGPYLGHDEAEGLAGQVNLADRTVLDRGLGWPQARGMEWLEDGYVQHAPVGTFGANAFGLHDMIGNVWEWCLDPSSPYDTPRQAGTGLRERGDSNERVARGGGYVNNLAFARPSIRDMSRSKDFDSSYHGVRPVLLWRAP